MLFSLVNFRLANTFAWLNPLFVCWLIPRITFSSIEPRSMNCLPWDISKNGQFLHMIPSRKSKSGISLNVSNVLSIQQQHTVTCNLLVSYRCLIKVKIALIGCSWSKYKFRGFFFCFMYSRTFHLDKTIQYNVFLL